jgi:acetylornithine deacetylase/succinyl-diaminopimelate desuccinylase-like protein
MISRRQRMKTLGYTLALAGLAAASAHAETAPAQDGEPAFRSLYKQLVETNTTLSAGSCTKAAEAMAARLHQAGLPMDAIDVVVPPEHPKSGALIATYAGRDRKLPPILLLAHIDVVEARREDWERDPFTLVEEGGFFYARGASDDKAMAAVFTDMLVRFQREGFKPRRDVKLALTCGEETPENFDGVDWLVKTHPEMLQARLVLNEGAGGLLDASGKPVSLGIQAGEKVYQDFKLETTNPGGHSSLPVRLNAINQLAAGLTRLAGYQFPARLNSTTRAYFEKQAELTSSPQVAADMRAVLKDPNDAEAAGRLWTANPGWNGMLRTTCVATQIDGGHAPNALPQRAFANVNCRILPDESIESVRQELGRVIADDGIKISLSGEPGVTAPVPPLSPQVLDPVRKVAAQLWPGVPLVPAMSTGATDGRYLNQAGIPTYGLSGMFHDADGSHAHGLNERIRVQSLLDGRRFLYEVVKIYSQQKD